MPTIPQDVDQGRFAAYFSEQLLGLVDPATMMSPGSMQSSELAEELIQPPVNLLTAIAEKPFAVLAMFLESRHTASFLELRAGLEPAASGIQIPRSAD